MSYIVAITGQQIEAKRWWITMESQKTTKPEKLPKLKKTNVKWAVNVASYWTEFVYGKLINITVSVKILRGNELYCFKVYRRVYHRRKQSTFWIEFDHNVLKLLLRMCLKQLKNLFTRIFEGTLSNHEKTKIYKKTISYVL